MSTPVKKRLLIFSIALNGYQWLYQDCLKSHARYANKIGADYVKIDRPHFTRIGTECCWLKLLLLKQALLNNYDLVLFLDADTEVQDITPDIREVVTPDKHIYMALGKTKRFNSGVILLQKSTQATDFIDEVLASHGCPLSKQDDVGWGENGHIIQAVKGNQWVSELPVEWNNSWQPQLTDYIRHYNHGIMRNQIKSHRFFNLIHQYLAKTTRSINRINNVSNRLNNKADSMVSAKFTPEEQLHKLFVATRRFHPQIF